MRNKKKKVDWGLIMWIFLNLFQLQVYVYNIGKSRNFAAMALLAMTSLLLLTNAIISYVFLRGMRLKNEK